MDRVNELLEEVKDALVERSEKKNNQVVKMLAIVGVIALAAAVIYLLYRFLQPDYYDDYDDDVYDDEYEYEVDDSDLEADEDEFED